MSDSYFDTGNQFIKGLIQHSYTRDVDGYTVSYWVYFRRTNSYSKDPTQGNISFKIRVNWEDVQTGYKNFTVKNGGDWCLLCSGTTRKFPLSNPLGTDSDKYTVGIWSNCSQSGLVVGGYASNGKELPGFTSDGFTVGSYATPNGVPTLELSDNGNNTFHIATTTGSSGTNNYANNCHIYYTTDGSHPDSGTGIDTGKPEGQYYGADISIPPNCSVVKAIAYTIGWYPSPGGVPCEPLTIYPTYYAAPTWGLNPVELKTSDGKKATVRSTLLAEWTTASPGNSNSSVAGYRCRVKINDKFVPNNDGNICDEYGPDTTSFNVSEYISRYGVKLNRGDVVNVTVHAWTLNGKGEQVWDNPSDPRVSNSLTIDSSGNMKIKLSNEWKEGQVFIKLDNEDKGIWVPADSVYMKIKSGKQEKWVESK